MRKLSYGKSAFVCVCVCVCVDQKTQKQKEIFLNFSIGFFKIKKNINTFATAEVWKNTLNQSK